MCTVNYNKYHVSDCKYAQCNYLYLADKMKYTVVQP